MLSMKTTKVRALLSGGILIVALGACTDKRAATSSPVTAAAKPKVLNLYLWSSQPDAGSQATAPKQPSVSDFLAPETIANFEKETGIKVTVTNYASDEELGAKLAAGNTEYDVVLPSAQTAESHIKAGYYQKLDKRSLPNLQNINPDIQARLALHDPNNEHAVLHMWGTFGLGYNVAKIKEIMPDAPLDSWSLVLDPKTVAKFKQCGVAFGGSPTEVYHAALAALGKNPNSQNPEDLVAATRMLQESGPYMPQGFAPMERLASGELCIAVTYNLEVARARRIAEQYNTGQTIAYSIPKEGSLIWFDTYVIPKGAPNPENAHTFINYMLRPQPAAAVTNTLHTATGVNGAERYVSRALLEDPTVYPSSEIMGRLVPDLGDTDEAMQIMTSGWERLMSAK